MTPLKKPGFSVTVWDSAPFLARNKLFYGNTLQKTGFLDMRVPPVAEATPFFRRGV